MKKQISEINRLVQKFNARTKNVRSAFASVQKYLPKAPDMNFLDVMENNFAPKAEDLCKKHESYVEGSKNKVQSIIDRSQSMVLDDAFYSEVVDVFSSISAELDDMAVLTEEMRTILNNVRADANAEIRHIGEIKDCQNFSKQVYEVVGKVIRDSVRNLFTGIIPGTIQMLGLEVIRFYHDYYSNLQKLAHKLTMFSDAVQATINGINFYKSEVAALISSAKKTIDATQDDKHNIALATLLRIRAFEALNNRFAQSCVLEE